MTKAWALVAAAVVIGAYPTTGGLANASPICEPRSAVHVAEHGGLTADRAWHVAHGERPTCGGSGSGARASGDKDDDGKSRYCRRHWFC